VKSSLEGLLNLIRPLRNITLNGTVFQVKFYLSCDYKMLRLLYGQKSANSTFGCVWCNKSLRLRPNFEEIINIDRNLYEPIEDQREPIIDFIHFRDTVIDVLHLLLRITDNLLKLLISKLTTLDNNDGADLNLRPRLKIFLNFLENDCNISNPWYKSRKGEDKIKIRSLNARERTTIFEKVFEDYIDLNEVIIEERFKKKNFYFIFPDFHDIDFELENFVWLKFFQIYSKIKLNELGEDFRIELRMLGRAYSDLNLRENGSSTLTPYWHSLIFHIEEMITLHGNISIFSNEPNEKLNDFSKMYYIKNTNKINTNLKYLEQLFYKRNRIEFFNSNGKYTDLPELD